MIIYTNMQNCKIGIISGIQSLHNFGWERVRNYLIHSLHLDSKYIDL